MSEHLTTRAFSALRWGYAGFAARALASFGSGVVLARLLGPKPFGQVAAAMLVFGLANQLANAGFSSALVQAPKLDGKDVRFAFTFQVAIGAALTVCCALVAPLVGIAMHDPVIGDVLRVTGLVFLIQAFGQTSASLLRRRLAFRPVQTAQVLSSVAGYAVVGVVAASLGAGVWSLVAAQLAQSITFTALVYAQDRHSVVPCWSWSSLRLARFGINVTGLNILNWSISNFDYIFVGRAFGSTSLGLYSRAFNTVSAPEDAIVSTWQQVLLAGCSRLGDRFKFQRAYLASLSAVALITFPVFWSVSACAPVVVAGLYGARWTETTPMLRPLAVALTLHAIMAMAGPILAAADQVRREVRTQALSLVVAIGVFYLCIAHSAVAIAWGVLGVYAFRFVVVTRQALPVLEIRWRDVIRALRGPSIAGAITAGAVWAASRVLSSYLVKPGLMLAALIATGAAAILILLLVAADRILSRELVLVLSQLSKSFPTRLSLRLTEMNARQASRGTARQRHAYKGASFEVTAP